MNVNSFDVNLFKKLCESTDENKNIFFSPPSISLALSMLLLGSNGTTKQQLVKALGLVKGEQLHSKLEELNGVLNSNSEGLQIKLDNSVFQSTSFQMLAKYKSDLESAFKCEIQTLDFMRNSDKSKTFINDLIADFANGKIENLFSKLDPESAYVLYSGLYLESVFSSKFCNHNTFSILTFHSSTKSSLIQFMVRVDYYHFIKFDNMKIKTLAVPLKQQHFKLLFILPIAVDNHQQELKEAVSCINQKLISLIIATHQKADFEKTKLLLKLPKFKIEYEANLNDIFRSLEIKDAFDRKMQILVQCPCNQMDFIWMK